ncbi:hypothetical protein ACFXTO_026853 [Malus domestica]
MEPAFVEYEHLEFTLGELWYGEIVTRVSSFEPGVPSRCLDTSISRNCVSWHIAKLMVALCWEVFKAVSDAFQTEFTLNSPRSL